MHSSCCVSLLIVRDYWLLLVTNKHSGPLMVSFCSEWSVGCDLHLSSYTVSQQETTLKSS